ncbi:MAG: radical SAM protein [Nitrosomonas sp.]|nr:MAG: radical SAM protein [Nitrosomonas sp.]
MDAILPVTDKQRTRSRLWYVTPDHKPRGFIQSHALEELWFHTGTACNLACAFCLEGSKPGDDRLNLLRFHDAKPFIDEALHLHVKQFSFTGGEPFVNKDLIRILDYALQYRPCMVLTNATEPLLKRLLQLESLHKQPNTLHFRVSLDHFVAEMHDKERGEGMFAMALQGLRALHDSGFRISVASQSIAGLSVNQIADGYAAVFRRAGLPENIPRIEFPEFYPPDSKVATPQITRSCMIDYQTGSARRQFMCAFSRMVVKNGEECRVYACTLVDDDPDYALAVTLTESLQIPVSMKHHRCYSCFRFGASCSEIKR